jgi:hypothetical protein
MNSDRKLFHTPDTPLAAYLYICGVSLINVDNTQHPSVFVFEENGNITIGELIMKWENGVAEGNVKSFYKTYKNFLKKIKGGSVSGD